MLLCSLKKIVIFFVGTIRVRGHRPVFHVPSFLFQMRVSIKPLGPKEMSLCSCAPVRNVALNFETSYYAVCVPVFKIRVSIKPLRPPVFPGKKL